MTEQEIIANAPKGSTHVSFELNYFKYTEPDWEFYAPNTGKFSLCETYADAPMGLRSLLDIRRIAELEKAYDDLLNKKDIAYEFEIRDVHIAELEKECDEFQDSLLTVELLVSDYRIDNAELEKERDVLTNFTMWALDAVFAGTDICGGDAQDKMFELGILTREIYNPEVHTLQQGSECDAGDYIYFMALKEDK